MASAMATLQPTDRDWMARCRGLIEAVPHIATRVAELLKRAERLNRLNGVLNRNVKRGTRGDEAYPRRLWPSYKQAS